MTLDKLRTLLETAPDLTLAQRTSMRSAITRFCEICGRHPMDVIGDPAVIRHLLEKANWQMAGLSKAGWANLRSNLTRALTIGGMNVSRCRRNFKPSAEWEVLLTAMTERDCRDLLRFAGWCTTLTITPEHVTKETFSRFLNHLETESIQRNPKERWHVARRAWNRALADQPGGTYPHIDNVAPADWVGLSWDAFPESLTEELDDYRTAVTSNNFNSGKRTLKPISVHNNLANLRRYLSRLVEDGVPIGSFWSLGDCLAPVLVKRGLELILGDRTLDETNKASMHAMMTAVLSIASHCGVTDADLVELKRLAKIVRHRPVGMSPRNTERLAQMRNPAVRRTLYRLPAITAQRLARVNEPTVRDAQTMQMAVLLSVLSHLPVRIKNAAALDLDRHIKRPVGGKAGSWLVHIPAPEVKNGVAIDAELNERVSDLLALYCERFRPILLKVPSTALFVGQTGRTKGSHVLGKQFSRFVRRETGLIVNPHLMRHYTAFVYLQKYPGDYETVRQLLGHKNIATTVSFYAGADTKASLKRLDEVISDEENWDEEDEL
jgi:integrase